MNNQPINELRLMFLEQIAIETPEATARLFDLRDAARWQAEYRVSAEWLDSFLRAVIEHGQARYDWISARRPVFDGTAAARGRLADWIGVRYAPAWIVFRGDWSDGCAKMLVSASATAWRQTIKPYQIAQEVWRAVVEAMPERITYLDPAKDKRRAERQCCWLASWLFARMSYEQIRLASGVGTWQIVERTLKKFAVTIGLTLHSQKGRRGRKVRT